MRASPIGVSCLAAISLLIASTISTAWGDGPAPSSNSNAPVADNKGPSADDVLDLVGGREAAMLAKYGGPVKASTVRSPISEDKDEILVWYDTFEARLDNGTVDTIYLNFSDWKTPIHGIMAGATQDTVRKALGTPDSTENDTRVVDTWNLKNVGYRLSIWYTSQTDANNNTVNQVSQAVAETY